MATKTDTSKSDSARLGAKVTATPNPPLCWAVVQLVALAFHIPLSVLTGSQSAIASRQSALVIGSLVAIAALVFYAILRRFLRSGWTALALSSVGVVVFWHWDTEPELGPLRGPLLAVVIYCLIGAAAVKFADRRLFKVVSFTVVVALSGSLVALIAIDALRAPDRVVEVQNPIDVPTLVERPDIILIVLDGYGRSDVIADIYGYDNEPFLDTLRSHGFDVAEDSTANYSITHLSLPSLLNMSYMHPDGATLGNNDLHHLADEVSGENQLVSTLKANDYSYVHAESDHWYNLCGDEVDICLPGPDPDITGHALLVKTPIGGLFYRKSADPTTALNLDRVSQLSNWERTSSQFPSGPRFSFFHLQLPHPPLYLDSDCDVRVEPDLGGRILNNQEMSTAQLEKRKRGWIEQIECANNTVLDFLAQAEQEAVVVLVSDHGPDLHFMVSSNPADITQTGLVERFSSLTAVRLPRHCRPFPNEIDTVNTFRFVLSCLSGHPFELLETRHYVAGFAGPIVEVRLNEQNVAVLDKHSVDP